MNFKKFVNLLPGLLALAGFLTVSHCGKKTTEAPSDSMTEKTVKADSKALSSCRPCHFLDKDQSHSVKGFGPGLMGIFNSKPVSPGIPFASWDEPSLDKWLSSPKEVKSDTKMTIKVSDPEKRKKIIEALKTL
jgi:cytochrome c2